MSNFIQILFSSLEIGSVYALATLGIIIIFQTSKMTNFAQGSIGMFNAYIAAFFLMKTGAGPILSTLVGMFSGFIMGILIDFIIMRRARSASPIALQIITMGIVLVLMGLAPLVFGGNPLSFPRFIPNKTLDVLGATISQNALISIALGAAILLVVFLFIKRTKWGMAVLVTASNARTARLMGVPTKLVTMGAWAVAAAVGTLAALMLAPSTVVDIIMMEGVQLNALIACVFGGFQTFSGPILGAYIIALTRNLFGFYISTTWGLAINYCFVLIFIIFRPQGLFGKKMVKKV